MRSVVQHVDIAVSCAQWLSKVSHGVKYNSSVLCCLNGPYAYVY